MHLDFTGIGDNHQPLVTRYAPSPTGYLHLGHVLNAIHVWGIADAVGARVLMRIEDHDRIRCRPEYEAALLEDLDWLGFVPDAGRHPPTRQSERGHIYQAAIAQLTTTAHVYACRCSRREIGGQRYPGTCRAAGLRSQDSAALRVEVMSGTERFDDLLLGPQQQHPAEQCGDLLLRDRDSHWTYQCAVTIDDMEQGVNLVIRGADLLDSTGRQLHLARLLGRNTPLYFAHHPLIMSNPDEKLSKATGATGIRTLRAAGLTPPEVIGRAATLGGLTDSQEEVEATAVARFWDRI